MAHFEIEDTPLDGLKIINKSRIADERGHFSRMFCQRELEQIGWNGSIAQINHTMTRLSGSIRGLHFQIAPYEEIKIVTCLRGRVFDVAVDLRPRSATFLQWQSCELSGENWKSFYIPQGFAHGFQTMSDDVEMLYLHDEFYAPEYEDGIHPQDKKLDISWPLDITELSERDRKLDSSDNFVSLNR